MLRRGILPLLPMAVLAGLAACTTTPKAPEVAPPPPPPPTKPVELPMSQIHRNITALEIVWHVRAGLNVAALSCPSQVGKEIVSDYNQFLKVQSPVLTQAFAEKQNLFKKTGAKTWERDLDRHLTRLYNHYAAPAAQEAFCIAAAREMKRALTLTPDPDHAWAKTMLANLDAPFAQAGLG